MSGSIGGFEVVEVNKTNVKRTRRKDFFKKEKKNEEKRD